MLIKFIIITCTLISFLIVELHLYMYMVVAFVGVCVCVLYIFSNLSVVCVHIVVC